MSGYHRLVIKLGTNLITAGKDSLDRETMKRLIGQATQLHQRGYQILVVTSGAVAAGKHRLGIRKKRRDVPFRQMMAAVGQGRLMQAYDELFSAHGITVAQTLLTRPDFSSRLGYLNARNTLLALLELGVVPIINENDVVFVEELEGATFGDNDNLSAMVANLVDADLLVILSDVSGLYTSDPNQDAAAELVPRVARIDRSIEELARGTSSERGTGGMTTKIEAAKLATASGTAVVIASGQEPNVILRLAEKEALGTFFEPVASRIEGRKRWMLGLPTKGKIAVDSGAKTALKKNNGSLLPAGITGVEGFFERGDAVAIVDSQDGSIGIGISNYGAVDISRIRGSRSESIPKVLGHGYGDEVVHRDNMVIL
ncbi:MAG: glutamate 5-kinase [Dehalococcoidia bacterium]|nr:glutamate 5-kinase [Dehalococcoidia bacterium]